MPQNVSDAVKNRLSENQEFVNRINTYVLPVIICFSRAMRNSDQAERLDPYIKLLDDAILNLECRYNIKEDFELIRLIEKLEGK